MDKLVLLTGSTSGIGKVAAKKFVEEGYRLVLPCRNLEKADALRRDLVLSNTKAKVDIQYCDFDKLKSVSDFCQYFLSHYERLDLLINNAGMVNMGKHIGELGVERTLQVNHLAPFLLTYKLLNLLSQTPDSRIVITSSDSHYMGNPKFLKDWTYKKFYWVMRSYADSKLANAWHAKKLARLLEGKAVVHYIHPGAVDTGIWPNRVWYEKIFNLIISPFLISPEKGAQPILSMALSPEYGKQSGLYNSGGKIKKPSKFVGMEKHQDTLWEKSLSLVDEFLKDE